MQLMQKQHKAIVVRAPLAGLLWGAGRRHRLSEAGSLEEQYLAHLLALVASKSYIEELIDEGFTVILDRAGGFSMPARLGKEKEGPMRTLMFEMATKMLSFGDNTVTRRAIPTIAPEVLNIAAAPPSAQKTPRSRRSFDASGSRYRAGVVQAYDDIAAYEKTQSPNFVASMPTKTRPPSASSSDFFLQSFERSLCNSISDDTPSPSTTTPSSTATAPVWAATASLVALRPMT